TRWSGRCRCKRFCSYRISTCWTRGRRVGHSDHPCYPTPEPRRGYRSHASGLLLRAALLLDSTPLDFNSIGYPCGDVRGMGVGCHGRYLCLMAASGITAVPGDVSRAMGAFTVPPATCPHGAILQHAASTRIVSDLHRLTLG